MTKRTNNSKQVTLLNIDENTMDSIKTVVGDSQLIPFNSIENAGDYANTHKIAILPNYDNNGNLTYYFIGLIPAFDSFIATASGKDYAETQFNLRVYKRIRDNMRQSILDGVSYTMPIAYSDFVTTSRESNGYSDEFKKFVTNFCKALIEKLSAKVPTAKALLTQKNMLLALANESVAKTLFPFLIGSDGNTILEKWLEKQAVDGQPFATVCKSMLATRNQQTDDASDDISVDDLI